MSSATAREIMKRFHKVEVGAYSYGDCFDPALVPPGVTIGRYVSIAPGARLIVQNHPMDRLSTHPVFYEASPGVAETAELPPGSLSVGHDVWIGYNAVVTPGCRKVGTGAVIGAGAVVTRDVPDYAVVAGNPARVVRYRFATELIERLFCSRWWELDADEAMARIPQLMAADSNDTRDDAGRNATGPAVSVVVPAHNEETVIGRCLRSMLEGSERGELDIVVVPNGCLDRTCDIARAFGPAVRVVETSTPSKIAALNLGDRSAKTFPRFYVDADVSMSIEAIRATGRLLEQGSALAAAPRIAWDLAGSSRLARAFYRVWRHQPYFDNGRLGSGVYAMNQEGHKRLGMFPEITADDEYVRRLFQEDERATSYKDSFVVTPPRTLRDLVNVKTRSRRGNLELVDRFPDLERGTRRRRSEFLKRILARPQLWAAVPVYLYVVTATYMRAKKTLRSSQAVDWERDLSSRNLAADSQ